MSGKAYTIQEMKQIVEYLTEHRAYSEIKGRKMWMDFANSKVTNRTWQSLKETFLKRILPDIHNPYYKLSMYQIASFRGGHDVEEKLKNKLEVREVTEESLSNANNKNYEDMNAISSKKPNDEDKGEDPIHSKIDRASTETLVLNNCYETAEDIKRDLMTPIEDNAETNTTKTLRDLIEFEPMTPDVQKLIDDFATDNEGSDGEPRMEIDLDRGKNCTSADEAPITLSDSDNPITTKLNTDDDIQADKQVIKNIPQTTNNSLQVTEQPIKNICQTTDNIAKVTKNEEAKSENKEIEKDSEGNTKTDLINEIGKDILNTSDTIIPTNSTIPDSILPNNQEELNKNDKINKIKTLSLNKKEVNIKSLKKSEANENKLSEKRKNSNVSINSDDKKLENELKKSRTESVERAKINTITETSVNISDSQDVSKQDNHNINKNVNSDDKKLSQSSENPCLQSVSLYDVQFAESKNSETESSIDLKPKNQEDVKRSKKPSNNIKNDVVILKSHSESATSNSESCDNRGPIRPIISKRYKGNALANVFGFTSGAARKRTSYRKRSISHQQTYDVSSESSDWTSDTASEYVSPPRGRRNRRTKKYLKPKSFRVKSLERNGGLFVVCNNKIYPLVKDGKIVKNYVNYVSDGESDEDRDRWKVKYLEEKKKSAILQRLLNHMQDKNQNEESRAFEVPICSSKCSALAKSSHDSFQIQDKKVTDTKNETEPKQPKHEAVQEEKPVKITFTKNNEEVQLEGPISHITPALAHVMELFQKPKQTVPQPQTVMEESRPSSPLLGVGRDEVQEKINQIENEIFKEIEEQDKIENTTQDVQDNVTKRNPIRRKTSTTSTSRSSKSPAKRPRVEQKENTVQKEQEETKTSADVENENAVSAKRQTRSSKIIVNEVNKNVRKLRTRSSLARKQTEQKAEVQDNADTNKDSELRYKFPSPSPTGKNSQTSGITRKSQQKNNNSTNTKPLPLPCKLSYSAESVRGYQDSDSSPAKICIKRGRPSFSTINCSNVQNHFARKSPTSITEVPLDVYESSNSFQDIKQSITFHNTTLSTEVYRSESYQLLMPINVKTSKGNVRNTKRFENLHEDSHLDTRSKSNERITPTPDIRNNAEGFSSSNVSLPTSPVLSIVENLSISRSLLTSVDDIPADDYDQLEMDTSNRIMLNDLMKSDLDAPMPLMERECRMDADHNDGINYHYNMRVQNTLTSNSQSLINKLNKANIEDQTLTESVNEQLKNLILDSNKKNKDKLGKGNKKTDTEDVDKNIQKGKTKKRSSTPRRRQIPRKVKHNMREPSIEEEHMETCLRVSRRSCPPVLQTNNTVNTADTNKIMEAKAKAPKDKKKNTGVLQTNNTVNTANTNKIMEAKAPKDKKKKDIIKVKISQPKDKANRKIDIKPNYTSFNQMDVNDSKAVVLQETDNSIDLIHNHSETCLQAHECIGDSVQLVKNSSSIISENSELSGKSSSIPMFNMDQKFAQEFYSCNARDGTEQSQDTQNMIFPMEAECPEMFHTPFGTLSSATSLMTDDLSFEIRDKTPPRCTKWYLFSEDENTNTNYVDVNQNLIKDVGYGANLNYLFPVTCAVPDLSTITELSKENDVETSSNLNTPLP